MHIIDWNSLPPNFFINPNCFLVFFIDLFYNCCCCCCWNFQFPFSNLAVFLCLLISFYTIWGILYEVFSCNNPFFGNCLLQHQYSFSGLQKAISLKTVQGFDFSNHMPLLCRCKYVRIKITFCTYTVVFCMINFLPLAIQRCTQIVIKTIMSIMCSYRDLFILSLLINYMNKLKKLSLIFISITFVMSILSLATLNIFFIIGGIASFALSLFYVYLNKARKTFKKDLLDNLK